MRDTILSVMFIIGLLATVTGFLLTLGAFENVYEKWVSPEYNVGLIDMILLSVTLLQFVVSAHFTAFYYDALSVKK